MGRQIGSEMSKCTDVRMSINNYIYANQIHLFQFINN